MTESKVFFVFKDYKVFFRPSSADEKVLAHSFDQDIFYKEIPDFNPSKPGVFFDIGAHIGTFSLLTSLKFPEAKIFAFEPYSESFNLLKKNIVQNELHDRISPIQAAISAKTGKSNLYLDSENWGHSLTNSDPGIFEEVDTNTIDNVVALHNIDFIDLVKLNCEGAEFEIIDSLSPKSLKKIGMMIILFHEDLISESANSRLDLANRLKENGFFVRFVNTSNDRGWIIAKNKYVYSALVHYFSLFWNNMVKRISLVVRRLLHF